MFQREVAERIVASTAERAAMGASPFCAIGAVDSHSFDVAASAFCRRRRLLRLWSNLFPASTRTAEARLLSEVTQAAFGQRRKMLRQSLKSLAEAMPGLARECRHRSGLRAEEIGVEGFAALARALVEMCGPVTKAIIAAN
jgi:16S rRNA (adenine1518-N6/adenine1519-N6)-dimethyltransferase